MTRNFKLKMLKTTIVITPLSGCNYDRVFETVRFTFRYSKFSYVP